MRTDAIRNLFNAFPELGEIPEQNITQMQYIEDLYTESDCVTIGAEVEVRWRHYFPHLYEVYLKNTPYSELSDRSKQLLTNHCSREEEHLTPRLKLTEQCGIPKGKDKYYEFAFEPCYNPAVLAYEVELLRRIGAIPTNHKHSLHITLGGLGLGKKAGMILMALEVIGFTSPRRISEVLNSKKVMSWGRKGRAGLRERWSDDVIPLQLGKVIGIELRTLELPINEMASVVLFATAFFLAHCATSNTPKFIEHWELICEELEVMAKSQNLDITKNWGRTNENQDIWKAFAEALPKFDKTNLFRLINGIPKLVDEYDTQ